ncbi:hypothetical protein CALCODRAFT_519187 [Calocera cornea HHB12733]|uniref:Uncharacterized protein n=1 Tax=Calocera cornea HHB12733 TaxID=1353952 RepID=A0A165EEA1_9BASI|nr:hypothetical protein CALCODRAFT_519187 [Calocera cornea HHB12733]
MSATVATPSSATSSPNPKEMAHKDRWAQAPAFLRTTAKALQHAIAKIDFEDTLPDLSALGGKNPFVLPPVPGVPSSSSDRSSRDPHSLSTSPIAERHNLPARTMHGASTKGSHKAPTKRVIRRLIKRKVVSARPEDLESEEELDTDMEVDVVVYEQPEEDTDEEEEHVHGDDGDAATSPVEALSPMSALTTPPPSDEESDYKPSTPSAPPAKQKSKNGTSSEIPPSVLVSSSAANGNSLVTCWKLERPVPSSASLPFATTTLQSSPVITSSPTSTFKAKKTAKVTKADKPPKSKVPKEMQKPEVSPEDLGPVVMQLCGYPNPNDPTQTCGIYTGGEVEQRRHRMKHLYLEWLRLKLGLDIPAVFGGYDATFASCPKCGKLFSRGFAADRHSKERNPCPQLTPEQLNDPARIRARYQAELDKAEKWMHFISTPVPRPKEAVVMKSTSNHKFGKIIEVLRTFDDRYDIIACKNGTDYEIKFFTEDEPEGGTKWFQSMGRRAYVKGELRATRGGGGGRTLIKFRQYRREHTVEDGTVKVVTTPVESPTTSAKGKGKAKSRKSITPKIEVEEDMLYAEYI